MNPLEIQPPRFDDLLGSSRQRLSEEAWYRVRQYIQSVRGLYGVLPHKDEKPSVILRRVGATPIGDPGIHSIAETVILMENILNNLPPNGLDENDGIRFLSLAQDVVNAIWKLVSGLVLNAQAVGQMDRRREHAEHG